MTGLNCPGACMEAAIEVKIGRDIYSVVRLQADAAVAEKAFRLERHGRAGLSYDIYLNRHGPHCECLGFLRWNKPCKHIRSLQAAGLL